jgi:hypothetical protein
MQMLPMAVPRRRWEGLLLLLLLLLHRPLTRSLGRRYTSFSRK